MNKFQTSTDRCFDDSCQLVRVCREIFSPKGGFTGWIEVIDFYMVEFDLTKFVQKELWSDLFLVHRLGMLRLKIIRFFSAPQKIKEPFSKALQRNFVKQVHPA